MTDLGTRRLDALVAEHVMGWGPIEIDRNGHPCGLNPLYPGPYRCHIVPQYLTDLTAAFEVIEKVGGEIEKVGGKIGKTPRAWLCRLYPMQSVYGDTWQSAWRRCVEAYLSFRRP